MENLLTYLLQINLLLVLIYLGYYFLLKGLTFYLLNRIYFVLGCTYAFIYPFLDIKFWFTTSEIIYTEFLPAFVSPILIEESQNSEITLLNTLITILSVVGIVFVLKLLVQLFSLLRIHLNSKEEKWQSYLFRHVFFPIIPFSFFNKIYIHKEQHREVELKDIFAHEIVHVRGHHTVDILLFEIILVVCWCNPFVWLMRKAVRQNLEFLTDQQVLNKGVNKQTYQYSLLNVTQQGIGVGIGNQFNFKTLKKRIMMMNKKRSSKVELSKYAFLLPVFLIAGASFTVSKAEKNIAKIVEKTQQTSVLSESLQTKLTTLLKEENEVGLIAIDKNEKPKDHLPLDSKFEGKLDTNKLKVRVKHNMSNDTSKIFFIDGRNKVEASTNKIHLRATRVKPLVILDGVIQKDDYDIYNLNSNDIASISVLKDKDDIAKYGDKAKEGVVLITSKKKQSQATNKSKDSSKTVFSINIKDSTQSPKINNLNSQKIGSEFLVKVRQDTSRLVRPISELPLEERPLIVIDEVPQKIDFELSSLNPNDIESVTVIKDKNATDAYGEKAKKGVIKIVLKKK